MFRVVLALAAVVFAFLGVAAEASAQGYSPAAKQVIERARQASGGAGWNEVRGYAEKGKLGGVQYRAWYDPVRYGARVETDEAGGKLVHGFNGVADWQIQPSGKIIGADDRVTMAQARTAAFIAVHGWFYPSRFGADGAHIGVRSSHGKSFDVLRVQPVGGEARELWFDRRSGLLTRIVDPSGAKPVTIELSDYRRVGAVSLPFKASTDRGGLRQDKVVEEMLLQPADRAQFSWSLPDTPK
jgi:hypothetical protein